MKSFRASANGASLAPVLATTVDLVGSLAPVNEECLSKPHKLTHMTVSLYGVPVEEKATTAPVMEAPPAAEAVPIVGPSGPAPEVHQAPVEVPQVDVTPLQFVGVPQVVSAPQMVGAHQFVGVPQVVGAPHRPCSRCSANLTSVMSPSYCVSSAPNGPYVPMFTQPILSSAADQPTGFLHRVGQFLGFTGYGDILPPTLAEYLSAKFANPALQEEQKRVVANLPTLEQAYISEIHSNVHDLCDIASYMNQASFYQWLKGTPITPADRQRLEIASKETKLNILAKLAETTFPVAGNVVDTQPAAPATGDSELLAELEAEDGENVDGRIDAIVF